MDSSQWQQGSTGVVRTADQNPSPRPADKKPRPDLLQGANCPRCKSTNTKFCYYNNYSLAQPRFFCKTCRRYWTQGGTLRNVPVGGGSRRITKHSSKKSQLPKITNSPHENPKFPSPIYNGLPTLPFPPQNPNFSSTTNLSFMDLLKTTGTFADSVFASGSVFSSGFPVHDQMNACGSSQPTVQDLTDTIPSRTGFPFEEPKPVSGSGFDLDRGLPLDSNGYWNGVMPGGSW